MRQRSPTSTTHCWGTRIPCHAYDTTESTTIIQEQESPSVMQGTHHLQDETPPPLNEGTKSSVGSGNNLEPNRSTNFSASSALQSLSEQPHQQQDITIVSHDPCWHGITKCRPLVWRVDGWSSGISRNAITFCCAWNVHWKCFVQTWGKQIIPIIKLVAFNGSPLHYVEFTDGPPPSFQIMASPL